MVLLSDEIMEDKKILGVVKLNIYGGMCYTVSGTTHEIKNKKEKDTATIETSKKDEKK